MSLHTDYINPALEDKNVDEQPVTKKQFDDFAKRFEKLLTDTINEVTETFLVRRECSLRVKPKMKSLCLYSLHPGDVINVMAVNHKWAYVSATDAKDSMPVTGWILKKYLQ